LAVVIKQHFPILFEQFAALPDNRSRPQYQVKELIVSGVLMFLFKQKSRNQADNTSKNLDYQDNIKKIFGIRVASMDTVNEYLKFLSPQELEQIKQDMFRELLKSKVLQKQKYSDKYFLVAIDGTGIQTYNYEPYPSCPFKTHKSGKKTWTAYALEAKVVTLNGFSISLATEWIENDIQGNFNKQDCELNAFKRLVIRLKKAFPRLEIMLLLDGLYPKNTVFDICEKYHWKFAITLKDKSLKSVQEQISDQFLFNQYQQSSYIESTTTHWIDYSYKLHKNMEYKNHNLTVIETIYEQKSKKDKDKVSTTRFVHITNMELTENKVHKFSKSARLRWKIENEGFNNQKNNDYELEHKFSRTSFNATKNYYQLLQIADMINQLTYKLKKVKEFLKLHKLTTKAIMINVFSLLTGMLFNDNDLLNKMLTKKVQLRY
jgi:hypothetical protein